MSRLRKWTKRALFVGLAAGVVLIASAFPGSGVASPLKATAPPLGTAESFAVLAGAGITNTGATVIDGGIGSFGSTTAITGFPPGTVNGTNHGGDGVTQGAKTDLTTAYNDAAGRKPVISVPTELGGTTLTPGVYTSADGTFGITGTLTLNGNGDASAVWIFQMASTLITATDSSVRLINGANSCNVFWQVGSSATLGTRTTFVGNILALTSITLNNGAHVSGRALARNGAVTLDNNRVDAAVCGAPAPTATAVPPTATATRTATSAPSGSSPGDRSTPGPTQVAAQTQIAAAAAQAAATSVPTSVPASAATSVPTSVPASAATSVPTSVPASAATSVPTSVPASAATSVPTSVPASAATSVPTSVPIPTPAPAMPRALPNAGDAGSPDYGWWMVAGLILSIAGFFFLRAGRRL